MESIKKADLFRDEDPEPRPTVPDLEAYLADALEVAFRDPNIDFVSIVHYETVIDVDKLAKRLVQIIKEKI